MRRIFCVLLGYLCGCFLTAEVVAHFRTGKSARELGSGNPGTVNIANKLGLGWGALVLLGDILKTVLAVALSRLLFPTPLATLYAGLGCALGHNFPFWNRFKGGKGVAVTCAFIVLFSPGWGSLACLVGLAVTLLTGWAPLGAVVIPTVFLPFAFLFHGVEAGILVLAATLLMFSRHWHGLRRIFRGEEKRVFRSSGQ